MITIITIVLLIFMLYLLYQMERNYRVYFIRLKWINEGDERYNIYSYNYMFTPSKSNYWGLKYPKETDFK